MYNKAVDAFRPLLECFPDCFFTNKVLEKLNDVVFSNDDPDLGIVNVTDIVTFFFNCRGIHTIDLNSNSLDDDNFDDDDDDDDDDDMILLIFLLLRLLLDVIGSNNVKHVKKDERRINSYSMASNKIIGLVYSKR